MKMSYLCIMTFWFCLTESNRLFKKHVYNSVLPSPLEQIYNVTSWVRQLHLQQCVLVEIGEKYCAVFIEYRSFKLEGSTVQEYFLGLCDANTLRKWKFCPAALEKERPRECLFRKRTEFSPNPARVHRRLCEVTELAFNADFCDCSGLLAGQKLQKVIGFPTCFLRPLPQTLCKPRNVCGVATCNASTVGQQIHIVECNPKCFGGQPFCESIGPDTSQPSEIHSHWSDWNELSCHQDSLECPDNLLLSEAICINPNTGMGAIDCLGPGTNCCPINADNCKCYIYTENGVLKLFRQIKLDQSIYSNTGRIPYRDRNLYKHLRSNSKCMVRSKPPPWRRFNPYQKMEEDEEDDDEHGDDLSDEDIILEEEQESSASFTTTESAEKDEIQKTRFSKNNGTEKFAFKEMSADMNQTKPSSANILLSHLFRIFVCHFISQSIY